VLGNGDNKMITSPELLKAKRVALGLNQAELAELLNVGQGYVSQLEAGRTGITAGVIRKYREYIPITDDDALFLLGLKEVE